MPEHQFRFEDGAGYERMMGKWSRLAGDVFLDWLSPARGLRWIDVGCGNGAFTELIVERYAPAAVEGVDPSPAQIAFARTRPAARLAHFQQGDAMALPSADDSFDAAVMALVIFFVPDPAKGVAEMTRVVRRGGAVAAYAWDMLGGGFPAEPILAEMRAMAVTPPSPPSVGASRMEALQALWTGAGLEAITTREIIVQRTFADFDARCTAPPGHFLSIETIALFRSPGRTKRGLATGLLPFNSRNCVASAWLRARRHQQRPPPPPAFPVAHSCRDQA